MKRTHLHKSWPGWGALAALLCLSPALRAAAPYTPPGLMPQPDSAALHETSDLGATEDESEADFEEEEEIVDFESEEAVADQEAAALLGGAASALSSLGSAGFKLYVDLLLDYGIGEKKWEFRPNHVIAILQMNVSDNVMMAMHLSDDPAYFELSYNVTGRLRLKAGKLMIPWGVSEFHHIIGGRVDELSHFLPETWSDFGVGLSYVLVDADWMSADYDLWLVNGFQGDDEPIIGAGTETDNNMGKGYGARLKMTFFNHYVLIGSLYHDVWDDEDRHNMVFYSLGGELRPGFIPLPVLDRLMLRGEWSRGEFKLPARNYQQGLLRYGYARTGFFAEATHHTVKGLSLRLRGGRINPNNTVTDEGDLYIVEPAVMIGSPKLMIIAAYQATIPLDRPYAPDEPADIFYAKFFLRY